MNIKLFLLTIASIVLLPFFVFAVTNDFVAGSDITISSVTFSASTADMLIFNGSTAESWTFDSGAFTVTNPGSAFNVGSSDIAVKSIQITQSGSTLVCTENAIPGTSFATLPTSSGTYTISPSATTACISLCPTLSNTASYNSFPACGAATCDTGYKLSESGGNATCVLIGGGGVFTGTLPNVTSIKPRLQTIYPDGTIVYHDENTTTVNVLVTDTKQPVFTGAIISAKPIIFTKTLKNRMKNDDVLILQKLLASDSLLYPEALITGYFGRLTERAVQRFQSKHNIVNFGTSQTTGYGLVGPKTRAKLQDVFNEVIPKTTFQSIVELPEDNIIVLRIFKISLKKGMFSLDIKHLQQLLNSDKDTELASRDAGSSGNETTFFGSITENAVKRFQKKYKIISSGTPQTTGYGLVGPKTRFKLNELFK